MILWLLIYRKTAIYFIYLCSVVCLLSGRAPFPLGTVRIEVSQSICFADFCVRVAMPPATCTLPAPRRIPSQWQKSKEAAPPVLHQFQQYNRHHTSNYQRCRFLLDTRLPQTFITTLRHIVGTRSPETTSIAACRPLINWVHALGRGSDRLG